MLIAANLLALIIVVGLCWAAMMWLSSRSARQRPPVGRTLGQQGVCAACDGVGARSRLGRLEPCKVCQGTGIADSQLSSD